MNYQLVIDDLIGEYGYSKQYVRKVLSQYEGKHVDILINSLGGDVDHSLAIRQMLIDHGDVTAYLSGFVASGATIIAMGAKHVVMGKYAAFLVHKCSNYIDVWGNYNADEVQALIDKLIENKEQKDKIDLILAAMYASKCKKPVAEISETLKAGKWLTADEALEMGFVDEVSELAGEPTPKFDNRAASRFKALGISAIGLTINEVEADEPKKNEMKKFDFSALASFFNVGEITPDKDGYVSFKAEEFETLNARLASLTSDLEAAKASALENEKKVAALEAQVENLQNAPGDTTNEIEDSGETERESALEMYNSIKDLI